jgi:hypothetical protein
MADANKHYYGSEQQWKVELSFLNTVGTLTPSTTSVVFDKFAGGDPTAPANKHRPGGMSTEVTYLSLPSFSDVTLTKAYNTQVDHDLVGLLHNAVGKIMCKVVMNPLDDSGAVFGATRTYTGRLVGVKDGGTDSMSGATRMWEVDISVETVSDSGTTGSAGIY